jgi:small-conductance mechanosensitive channel
MLAVLELPPSVKEFLAQTYLGNTYHTWAVALLILLGSFLLLGIAKRIVHHHLTRLAARTTNDVDDLIADLVKRTKRFFLFVMALWLAHHFIDWSAAVPSDADAKTSKVEIVIRDILTIGFWAQVGCWAIGLVAYATSRAMRGKSEDDPARTMGVTVLSFLGHTIVWSIVVLSCLNGLGFAVGPLIASLGVGGIAVALALQNVLGDLFASITILLDKPFVVGDGVQIGEFNGTIERIGVKTTRLRSVNGEEIVMGNNDLVSSRIRNFKRLNERRVVLTIGIEFDTPVDVVAEVPAILAEIIGRVPGTRFDRAHFKGFGDSALQFEAVYFCTSAEYIAMMDVQQAVNLAILRRFEKDHISFAFPTQTVRHVGGKTATTGLEPHEQALAAHVMRQELKKPN